MTRILYVDDDPDIREIALLALELDGDLEVRACASGAEAIEVAPAWAPSLILLDVMMPQLDGPATLAALRGMPRTAAIPVVFITARAYGGDNERLRSLGAEGVIAKPFDPMRLAEQVRGFLTP